MLTFIDNFQFLGSPLDILVRNLGKVDFKYLSQEFDSDVLDLLKQKGFYPYEYMSSFKKFKEEWPSKEHFYSCLTSKQISDKEYEHVLKAWNRFEMKTIKDHQNLYLKWHILLLTDVFEKFRNSSLKNYGLCPSHYLSVTDLSWNAVLSITKIEFKLISDADMYLFFEKGMRGGVSYISKGNQNILYTWMPISCMVMLCLSFFQQADSNG